MPINAPRAQDGKAGSIAAEAMRFGPRILGLADRLAEFSETEHGLTCTFMTPAHRAVAREVCSLMVGAGMTARIDAIGNVMGRYSADRPDAPALIVGSHYDTVRNAGKYDGRLGILAGIIAVEELRRRKVALPFHIDVIGFSEEEGVRFSVPYLGSAAIAGRFEPAVLNRRNADGQSLADVLREFGGNAESIAAIGRRAKPLGYVEVHIEQGPVLLDEDLPVGIVTAIAGSVRYRVLVRGAAGHAGAVPMNLRHDAVAAAAEIVALVEHRCSQSAGLMGTVGQFHVPDGAINVIPGRCELSLDIRSGNAAELDSAVGEITREIDAIAARRGVSIDLEKVAGLPPVACTSHMQNTLARAVAQTGYPIRHLLSGPGHDAVMFGGITDIGMLFVRCGNNGISHSPLETITAEDAEIAAQVLINFLVGFELKS